MVTDIRERLLAARLPAMPQALLKLLGLCRRNDSGFAEFAAVIAQDAGIAGRILGVANSAAYQRNGRHLGLEQSLVTLGTNTIRSLVIGESVAQVFNHFSRQCPVDLSPFWRHSLTTAVIAREIATAIAYPQSEEAYLAGLLHDVGRIALLGTCPQEYAPFFSGADDEASCEQEKQLLQITHAEVGAWLAERWQIDSFLADSVLYHHQPVAQLHSAAPLVKLVFVANRLAEHAADSAPVAEAAALLALSPQTLADIASRAGALVTLAAEQLGIALPSAAEKPVADDSDTQLAEAVRDIVSAAEATRPLLEQHDQQNLSLQTQTLVRAAGILFGATDAALLRCDAGQSMLTGTPADDRQQLLAQISLPLSQGTPIADAVLGRTPTFIDAGAPAASVGEAQLLRLLNADAAACLPLIGSSRVIGVLVCAFAAPQLARLRQRNGFLQAFAAYGASALEVAEMRAGSGTDISVAHQHEATRRMVHEANNPLSIIKNYLSVLDRKLKNQQTPGGEIAILNEEIDRVATILRAFAQGKPAAGAPAADINRVITDVASLFSAGGLTDGALHIATRLGNSPLAIAGDRDALRQILINLVKNAAEAMPGGGEIRISASGPVNFGGELFAEIDVSDSGPGIPPALLGKLFGPLTSTKAGDNRGLGLSIVKELVDRLGGKIGCSSSDQGTSFTVLLPALQPDSPADGNRSRI